MTAGSVCGPGTTSASGMMCAGVKKWAHTLRLWMPAGSNSNTLRLEVLLANTVRSGHSFSSWSYSSRLASLFSTMVSMTKSASLAASSMLWVGLMRATAASASA